jgi:hypothetical protein
MKKLVSCGIVGALICCVCLVANGKTEPEATKATTTTAPVPASTDAKRSEKLRADVQRLVADTKAGKIKVPAQQFPQSTNRNNMSTGAKIAIVAIIAGTVFLIFMFHAINSD